MQFENPVSRIILNIDLHSVIIISTVFDRKQNEGIFMPEKENEETESIISSVSPLNETVFLNVFFDCYF